MKQPQARLAFQNVVVIGLAQLAIEVKVRPHSVRSNVFVFSAYHDPHILKSNSEWQLYRMLTSVHRIKTYNQREKFA